MKQQLLKNKNDYLMGNCEFKVVSPLKDISNGIG